MESEMEGQLHMFLLIPAAALVLVVCGMLLFKFRRAAQLGIVRREMKKEKQWLRRGEYNAAMVKGRQNLELLLKIVAELDGIQLDNTAQAVAAARNSGANRRRSGRQKVMTNQEYCRYLGDRGWLDRVARWELNQIRILGNRAVHENFSSKEEAWNQYTYLQDILKIVSDKNLQAGRRKKDSEGRKPAARNQTPRQGGNAGKKEKSQAERDSSRPERKKTEKKEPEKKEPERQERAEKERQQARGRKSKQGAESGEKAAEKGAGRGRQRDGGPETAGKESESAAVNSAQESGNAESGTAENGTAENGQKSGRRRRSRRRRSPSGASGQNPEQVSAAETADGSVAAGEPVVSAADGEPVCPAKADKACPAPARQEAGGAEKAGGDAAGAAPAEAGSVESSSESGKAGDRASSAAGAVGDGVEAGESALEPEKTGDRALSAAGAAGDGVKGVEPSSESGKTGDRSSAAVRDAGHEAERAGAEKRDDSAERPQKEVRLTDDKKKRLEDLQREAALERKPRPKVLNLSEERRKRRANAQAPVSEPERTEWREDPSSAGQAGRSPEPENGMDRLSAQKTSDHAEPEARADQAENTAQSESKTGAESRKAGGMEPMPSEHAGHKAGTPVESEPGERVRRGVGSGESEAGTPVESKAEERVSRDAGLGAGGNRTPVENESEERVRRGAGSGERENRIPVEKESEERVCRDTGSGEREAGTRSERESVEKRSRKADEPVESEPSAERSREPGGQPESKAAKAAESEFYGVSPQDMPAQGAGGAGTESESGPLAKRLHGASGQPGNRNEDLPESRAPEENVQKAEEQPGKKDEVMSEERSESRRRRPEVTAQTMNPEEARRLIEERKRKQEEARRLFRERRMREAMQQNESGKQGGEEPCEKADSNVPDAVQPKAAAEEPKALPALVREAPAPGTLLPVVVSGQAESGSRKQPKEQDSQERKAGNGMSQELQETKEAAPDASRTDVSNGNLADSVPEADAQDSDAEEVPKRSRRKRKKRSKKAASPVDGLSQNPVQADAALEQEEAAEKESPEKEPVPEAVGPEAPDSEVSDPGAVMAGSSKKRRRKRSRNKKGRAQEAGRGDAAERADNPVDQAGQTAGAQPEPGAKELVAGTQPGAGVKAQATAAQPESRAKELVAGAQPGAGVKAQAAAAQLELGAKEPMAGVQAGERAKEQEPVSTEKRSKKRRSRRAKKPADKAAVRSGSSERGKAVWKAEAPGNGSAAKLPVPESGDRNGQHSPELSETGKAAQSSQTGSAFLTDVAKAEPKRKSPSRRKASGKRKTRQKPAAQKPSPVQTPQIQRTIKAQQNIPAQQRSYRRRRPRMRPGQK